MRPACKLAAVVTVAVSSLVLPALAQAEFGLTNSGVSFTGLGGAPVVKAGIHPDTFTTEIEMNTRSVSAGEEVEGAARDIVVHFPMGFAGTPNPVPPCESALFAQIALDPDGGANNSGHTNCPAGSIIGKATVNVSEGAKNPSERELVPVFNLVPPPGAASKIGFIIKGSAAVVETFLSTKAPYHLVSRATTIPNFLQFNGAEINLWGVPGDSVHDPDKQCHLREPSKTCPSLPDVPFVTLPRTCAGPLQTTFEADSWEAPGVWTDPVVTETNGLEGCEELEFGPQIGSMPTSAAAESPTGLDFELGVDDPGLIEAGGTADSDLRKAVVTLPEGVTTNPSIASGLSACTLAQYESETVDSERGTGCPESSKIGSVEVETPLLQADAGGLEVLPGSVYVAKQGDNPFGNLLTIYVVIKHPRLGILVQAAGRVEPDPVTGQLRTTFDDLPQLPFSDFRFHFREGQRAPLITPATCGRFTTTATLYPWAEGVPVVQEADSFTIGSGANGAPCATSRDQLPNRPSLSAGTLDPEAGAHSPFVFNLSREDGSQQLQSITATLPDGLTGKLAGIPYCSEAQIGQAQARGGEGQGALELAQPSCPLASRVGTVTVAAGAGSQPYHVEGSAYLAGPYKGAPLSLAIVTPAIAGPFDLGVVAVRTALRVDPETARITAVSDPIPTILHGLPLVVRSVSLDMGRPSFMLNPTGCEPKSIEASATSVLGQAATLSQYFQASDCGALGFKPKLALKLNGGTKRGDNPALRATASFPTGFFANTARVRVALPHSEFLDQEHIRTICTRVQFAADQCPKGSIYGTAKATTPLLDQPLSGPVYLRASSNPLPDLVADLRGQVQVALVGKIDSVNGGIRTTFAATPDVPVRSFVLSMRGGRKGLLINSTDICRGTHRARASFVAHNAKAVSWRPAMRAQCKPKPRKQREGRPKRRGAG